MCRSRISLSTFNLLPLTRGRATQRPAAVTHIFAEPVDDELGDLHAQAALLAAIMGPVAGVAIVAPTVRMSRWRASRLAVQDCPDAELDALHAMYSSAFASGRTLYWTRSRATRRIILSRAEMKVSSWQRCTTNSRSTLCIRFQTMRPTSTRALRKLSTSSCGG